MVRAGLSGSWKCTFANDINEKKAKVYAENWGNDHLTVKDINSIKAEALPGQVNLAWASFPCQDLSLAGRRNGLEGERSGTFWAFWSLITDLFQENRAPDIITLENVYGTLTSNQGRDFTEICKAFTALNYQVGAAVIDGVHFLPQSRPRLFIVGIKSGFLIPPVLKLDRPSSLWHPDSLIKNFRLFSDKVKKSWIWWNIPRPQRKNKPSLTDLMEALPEAVEWHTPEYTAKLLASMTPRNFQKVEQAMLLNREIAGALYRRTRNGKVRAEVRFDGTAGCLRTPSGGSSRQFILIVHGKEVKSRLLSAREAARLMGLPDNYRLPANYNEAYHLAGDGVVVPIVNHLREFIFEPIIDFNLFNKPVSADGYERKTQGALL